MLTSAHVSYITPLNEDWFAYGMPKSLETSLGKNTSAINTIKDWLKKSSEIALEELAKSNFYTVIHGLFKDRSTLGTACMILLKSQSQTSGSLFNFRHIAAGTYVFTEDDDGKPKEFGYERKLTLAQAIDEYGEEPGVWGDKVSGLIAATKEDPSKLYSEKITVIIWIRPNDDEYRESGKSDIKNKVYLESHIAKEDPEHEVKLGGYDEFPVCITRYEKWGNERWGFAPTWNAMVNVLSANYIKKLVKTMGEISLFPRILKLSGQKRQVSLKAGGQTIVSEKEAQMGFPKEWGTNARFDAAEMLLAQEHESIEQFFHVPLFRMFATLDKTMTATEVAAREREKLLLFAPSFTQFVTDLGPTMLRIFAMLAREGVLPAPPQEMAEYTEVTDTAKIRIPNPEVVFQSRVALAIKALAAEGFDRVMMRWTPMLEVYPQIVDNLEADNAFRDMMQSEGLRARWIRPWKEVEELRAARQEQEQMQNELAAAESMTKSLQQAGGVEGAQQIADTMAGPENVPDA